MNLSNKMPRNRPMKRDVRLRQLSVDHHHALVLARRSAAAAASTDLHVQRTAWDEVVRRFHADLAPHFEIEETYLLPALELVGAQDIAQRTRDEHAELIELVTTSVKDLQTRLQRFGTLLQEHVRFEERELFELAQTKLSGSDLQTLCDARDTLSRTSPPGSIP